MTADGTLRDVSRTIAVSLFILLLLGSLFFRTWIIESNGNDMVIYDCPPEHQPLIEGADSVSIKRGTAQYKADVRAVLAEDLSSEEYERSDA